MAVTKLTSKKKRIELIVKLLTQGADRKNILQKFSKSFKGTDRTLDNDIKAAKLILSKRESEAEAIRIKETEIEITNSMRAGLKTDLELELILCKIAGNDIKVEDWIKGAPVLRGVSPFEIIAAIDKIYKKRGSYPEIAAKLKGDKENPWPQPFSDSQVDTFIKALRENKTT